MGKLSSKIISQIDSSTIRFQGEVMNRLKLFDFSKTAILYYTDLQKKELQGYSFDNFQHRFKLVEFKDGSKLKSIQYKDMVDVGNLFIKEELSDSIYVLNMATFEHWLLSSLRTLILSNPHDLYPSTNKTIDITFLKKFTDIKVLWEELVDDYLKPIPYQGMKFFLKTFLKSFAHKEVDTSNHLLDKINENSMCRNLIVHNQKKVNSTYINKCGKFALFSLDDTITITEELLFAQADNLLRFMQDFRKNLSKNE